ncbi:MAG TPA: glutamate racemase [Bryobacteraceae bacterium]|nr:glutamate racemase [Bryobacteraceae bacterium]
MAATSASSSGTGSSRPVQGDRPTELPTMLHRPIGIFDSGVGGLTVLKALRRKLPRRDFVYLGDTARVPYGRKPAAMVAEFAYGITEFLRGMGVAGVVIACNTASASALPELAGHFSIPIWGVIDPGVEAAARLTRTGRVGVIGTQGTIASGAYQQRLEQRGLTVWARACPMLVHIVEEGLANSPECDLLLRHYLDGCGPIDTLILGCTHYPLLHDAIQRTAGDEVRLVDSAEALAQAVNGSFSGSAGAEGSIDTPGRIVHFVTGDPLAFGHTANVIGEVQGEVVPLPVTELIRLQKRGTAANFSRSAAPAPHPSRAPDR